MRPLCLAALACIAPCFHLSAADYTVAYVGADPSPALRGVELGIAESNVQGQFLGVSIQLVQSDSDEIPDEAIAVLVQQANAVRELAVRFRDKPVFNLSNGADELRSACLSSALHVIPSTKMKMDAVKQWVAANPGSRVSSSAWHPDAVKFAARDLNNRFRKRFGEPMNELAWAGWFSARAVGDTLMREGSNDPASLLRSLKASQELDGQKGDPHSFRASGQLRQPLVLVNADGSLAGEAPVRGAPGGLDSLGATPCE